jgi:adenylate kinase
MQGKFVIITGMSGVGKSTITRNIETCIKPITRIGFGELIFEIKNQMGATSNYEQLRESPNEAIPINYVNLAEELLLSRVSQLRQTTNIVLDSHAVVNDHFGFRIVPEISNFDKAHLDAIIVIHATFEVVKRRLAKEPKGRPTISKPIFESYKTLQDSVAIYFGLTAKCPVYILETDNNIDKSVNNLREIFRSIGMYFENI